MSVLEKIKNNKDLKKVVLNLWDVEIVINQLTIKDRLALEKNLKDKDDEDKMLELVRLMVTDTDGNKIFKTDEDLEILLEKSPDNVRLIFEACGEMLSFDDKDVKQLEKKY